MTQITDLPYLCVQNIFTYLPVTDIIRIDLVFPEWTSIQSDYLKKRCHLTLLLGGYGLEPFIINYGHLYVKCDCPSLERDIEHMINQCNFELLLGDKDPTKLIGKCFLKMPMEDELADAEQNGSKSEKLYLMIGLDGDQIADGQLEQLKLSQSLPWMKWLEVVVSGPCKPSLDRLVVPMIESFADRLITFKLSIDFYRNNYQIDKKYEHICISTHLHSLLECINSRMIKLERLYLDFEMSLSRFYGDKFDLDLPILRQLKEFSFHSYDRASILYESLHRYATERSPTIAIGNFDCYETISTQFGSMSSAKNFDILPQFQFPVDLECFAAFASLRSVRLFPEFETLSQLTRCLLPLRNLVHLELSLIPHLIVPSQFDSTPDEQIHPLPVRAFSLIICAIGRDQLRSRHWPRMFPACRVLEVGICRHCNCTWHSNSDLQSYQKSLASFKALPNLCKIYANTFYGKNLEFCPDQL